MSRGKSTQSFKATNSNLLKIPSNLIFQVFNILLSLNSIETLLRHQIKLFLIPNNSKNHLYLNLPLHFHSFLPSYPKISKIRLSTQFSEEDEEKKMAIKENVINPYTYKEIKKVLIL